MIIEMVGLTHQGMVRDNNEDNISLSPDMALAVLADGMGGHQAGEVASGLAVEVVRRFFENLVEKDSKPSLDLIDESIRLANSAIYDVAQENSDCAGMGTTVVAVAFNGNHIYIGHVGDSRLYRLRGGTLEQITEDHSVVQELVSRGFMTREEASMSMNKNLVTRALGIDREVEATLADEVWMNEDLYLLCSDGLTDVVPDQQIEAILNQGINALERAADQLVEQANEAGGPDNISVVLVRANSGNHDDKGDSDPDND